MRNFSRLFITIIAGIISIEGFSQGSTGAIAPPLSANSGQTSAAIGASGRPDPDSRGWSDPALNHNRLLRNQLGEGTYVIVGTYKVTGSPFLFGGSKNADIFTQKEKALNITVSYNTYSQDVDFYSTSNPTTALTKTAGEVDSFVLKQDIGDGILQDLTFVYGTHAGSSEKAYFQKLAFGHRFNLYKRYKSELGFSSTNYGMSDLRVFEMTVDYFYYDAETKAFKKIKPNLGNIVKEFKSIKDVSGVADKNAFSVNPE